MRQEGLPGTRVLVVERSGALAPRLRECLPELVVLEAPPGTQAFLEVERHHPALVVVDGRGVEDLPALCSRLRTDTRFGNPLTFLVTAHEPPVELLGVVDEWVDTRVSDVAMIAERARGALRRTAEMRDSSPLTGLPGNAAISAALRTRVESGRPVALLYADLDNFKAFNDHYGFVRGDEAIVTLAGILRAVMADDVDAFVGHIGGDDFVVLTGAPSAERFAQRVLDRFEAAVPGFYDARDRRRGGIEVTDRLGERRFFPLVSLSIGIASNLRRPIADHRELVLLATEMKNVAKTRSGNAYATDRRTGPVASGGHHPRHRSVRLPASPAPDRRAAGRSRGGLRRAARVVSAGMVATVMLLSTTAAMASTAVPGDALWPAKLAVEQLQLRLAGDTERELSLRVEFAMRRLNELAGLSAGEADPRLVERTADALDRELDALTRRMAAGLAPASAVTGGLDERLGVTLRQHALVLEGLRGQACGVARPGTDAERVCRRVDLAATAAELRLAEAGYAAGRVAASAPASSTSDALTGGLRRSEPAGAGNAPAFDDAAVDAVELGPSSVTDHVASAPGSDEQGSPGTAATPDQPLASPEQPAPDPRPQTGSDAGSPGSGPSTAPAEPAPAEPTPAEPTPAEPTPAEPTPAEPTPAEPAPAGPASRLGPTAVTAPQPDANAPGGASQGPEPAPEPRELAPQPVAPEPVAPAPEPVASAPEPVSPEHETEPEPVSPERGPDHELEPEPAPAPESGSEPEAEQQPDPRPPGGEAAGGGRGPAVGRDR